MGFFYMGFTSRVQTCPVLPTQQSIFITTQKSTKIWLYHDEQQQSPTLNCKANDDKDFKERKIQKTVFRRLQACLFTSSSSP